MIVNYLIILAKLVIFISIINVWFFRFGKSTPFRPKDAGSMQEEFKTYGLSNLVMYLVGGLKIFSALLLVLSIWYANLAVPAAGVMAFLMLGAVGMHIKVNDPLKKSVPALIFLLLSVFILAYHL